MSVVFANKSSEFSHILLSLLLSNYSTMLPKQHEVKVLEYTIQKLTQVHVKKKYYFYWWVSVKLSFGMTKD